MIVTVTPNPSLDRTVAVDRLVPGAIHHTDAARLDPGGKGVNVARALAAAGSRTVAVLPTGGAEGVALAELLTSEGVPVAEVPIGRPVRSNLALVEADGTTSKFNEPGPELTGAERDALEARSAELAETADWLVSCGSLPAGDADDLHARLVRAGHASGTRVAVDASGAALAAACAVGPELIKPNLHELSGHVGRPLPRLGDVLAAAAEVREAGVRAVLVSLGEHGALLAERGGAWHATSRAVPAVRSTVGAGDATLAGFLRAGGSGPAALRAAVAYGTTAVGLAGSRMPAPHQVRTAPVRVDEVDETLSLTGAAA